MFENKTPYTILLGTVLLVATDAVMSAYDIRIPLGPTARELGLSGVAKGLRDLNNVPFDPFGLKANHKNLGMSDGHLTPPRPVVTKFFDEPPARPPAPIYRLDRKAIGARYTLQHPAKPSAARP